MNLAALPGFADHRPTGELKIWDAANGKLLRTLPGARSVAVSPDSRWVAAPTTNSTIVVWDIETGKQVMAVGDHLSAVNSVAFSPDGRRLASASDDQTVKVSELVTGRTVLTLHGHGEPVKAVAFSSSGRFLVSVSQRSVRIWEAPPIDEAVTFPNGTKARYAP